MNIRLIIIPNSLIQLLLLIAALLTTTLPILVSAQSDILEEIIVTANRREQSIQDIPVNISAMTGGELEAAGVSSLADLSQVIPGLAYSDLGVRSGGVNNQLILRGLNTSAQGSIGAYIANLNPGAVSTYMDNTPLFTNLRMYDLARVEVLRGPQGTLYGANSVGGTLRFIFNQPDPEAFAAKIDTGFSTTEDADDLNYTVDGVVNIPLSTKAALRISAGYKETAGFTDARALVVGGPDNPQLADPTNPFGPLATMSAEDTDDAEQWYLRASLLWEITERIEAQFTYHRQEEDADGFSYQTASEVRGVPFAGAQERTHDAPFNSPLSREVDLFSLELGIDLAFARLESTTSYYENKEVNDGDLSFVPRSIDVGAGGFVFGGYPTTNGNLVAYYDEFHNSESFVQELRLISQSESKFQWVAGFYYEDLEVSSPAPSGTRLPGYNAFATTPNNPFVLGGVAAGFLPPFLAGASFADAILFPPLVFRGFGVSPAGLATELFISSDRLQTVEDIAIYGELSYQITDAWQVTAGARVFWNDFSHSLTTSAPVLGAFAASDRMNPLGLSVASFSDDRQDETFKINTSYNFNNDLMAYFTWAEGFRRGGSNAFPAAGPNAEDPSLSAFPPDTVTNYELGIKGVLFDRLRYTAAIYRIDWDKPQIAGTFIPSAARAIFSGEEARTEGIELQAEWAVTDELMLSGGYSYTEAELTADYTVPLGPGDVVPDAFGTDGDPLPGVPEHQATWALDYVRPVNFFGESMIHFRVDGSYRSSVVTASSTNAVQFENVSGFDMWNASLNWSNEHWRVGAYVRNIADEIGITQVVRDFAIAGPTENLDFVSRPRTIGVMIGYTY